MKILNQIDPNTWLHKFTCKKCSSELEANVDDLKYHYSEGDGPYPSSEIYLVTCPVCNHDSCLDVKELKIPEVVLIKAKTKYRPIPSGLNYYKD